MSIIIQGFPNNGAYTQDDIRGYKVYTASLYQIGTGPLQANVFENTIDQAAQWTVLATGTYKLVFPNLPIFNGAKIWTPFSGNYFGSANAGFTILNNSDVYYVDLSPSWDGNPGGQQQFGANGIILNVVDGNGYINTDLSTALSTPIPADIIGTINIEIRLYP